MASIKKQEGKNGVTYKITVTSGRDMAGKQIRHYLTWKPEEGMTQRQIDKKVKEVAYKFEHDLELGYNPDDKRTFAEYADYCYNLRVMRGDKPQTLARVKRQSARICEYIGNIRLVDLRPYHINSIYEDLLKKGSSRRVNKAYPIIDFKKLLQKNKESYEDFANRCKVSRGVIQKICNGEMCSESTAKKISFALNNDKLFHYVERNESLSTNTILDYHGTMSSILSQAEKEMIIPYNPVKKATPPKKKHNREKKSIQPNTFNKLINALDTESIRTKTILYMYSVTGCRRGEILGLKWSKVDIFNKVIHIDTSLNYLPELGIFEGPTKTEDEREIPISDDTIKIIMDYRKWQDEERLKYGDKWENTEYVFTNQKGGAVHPNTINVMVNDFCKRHDLPKMHPHTFRHTVASILISRNVDIVTVAAILGHSDPTTTLETYAHEIDEAKKNAINCVSDIVLRKKA